MSPTEGAAREALDRLQEERDAGAPPPDPNPERLPLAALHTVPEAFQGRHPLLSMTRFGETAGELLRRIRQGIELDPMKVWWSGARWIVLDGHHRLEAYRVAAARERTPPESYAVPVRAFEGTPEEAYEEAPQENAKVRNPISSAERQEWAWRTLVSGVETSPTKISEAAGVSRQQVYNMKKKLAELRGAGREPAELEELGWWRCRSLDVERSDAPVDEEAMDAFHAHREEVIDRLFRALDREFGGKWHKMADFFAHGLAERAPKFAHMLVDSEAFWPLVQEVHAAELREEHEEEAMAVELQRLNGPKRDDLPF